VDFPEYSDKQMDLILDVRGQTIRENTDLFLGMLPDAQRRSLWKLRGLTSLSHYSNVLAGIARSQREKHRELYDKLEDLPELRSVLVRVPAVKTKIRTVLRIATPENDPILADYVKKHSKAELEIIVRDLYREKKRSPDRERLKQEAAEKAEARESNVEQAKARLRQVLGEAREAPGADASEAAASRPSRDGKVAFRYDRFTADRYSRIKHSVEQVEGRRLTHSAFMMMLLQGFTYRGEQPVPFVRVYTDLSTGAEFMRTRYGGIPVDEAKLGECVRETVLEEEYRACKERWGRGEIPGNLGSQSGDHPSRHIPARVERLLGDLYDGFCAMPYCNEYADILHHIYRWALERCHDPDCIFPVCLGHHGVVHVIGIENEETLALRGRPRLGRSPVLIPRRRYFFSELKRAKVGSPNASAAATRLTAPATASVSALNAKMTATHPVSMLLRIKNQRTVLIDLKDAPFCWLNGTP